AKLLEYNEPCLCEVKLSTTQVTEPKVSSRRLPDGRMVSGTLADMAPFLSDEEMKEIMSVSSENGCE
ncbi:MAG: hypothetical protein IJ725_06455, partial [Ruminococcus sp.]|nr:hypothetical protein [Ruminococcus sp.]